MASSLFAGQNTPDYENSLRLAAQRIQLNDLAIKQATDAASKAAQGKGSALPPGSTTSSNRAGQYFADPGKVNTLSSLLTNVAGTAGSYYNEYLRNPAQSPLFTNQLGTLLSSLKPSEAASRTALADQFRQAGALNSGAFAKAATQNESDILGNREKTAANLLGSTYGPTLQAILGGVGQANPLISNLTLNESSGESQTIGGGNTIQPSFGGGGGGGGGSTGGGLSSLSTGAYFPNTPQGGISYGNQPAASQRTEPYMSPDQSLRGWGTTPDYYTPGVVASGGYGGAPDIDYSNWW